MSTAPSDCIALLRKCGYTYDEVADALGVARVTLGNYVAARRGVSWEVGEKIRLKAIELLRARKADIDKFLEENEK